MRPPYILPLIIVSQFAGTSLWFAVNALLPEIAMQGTEGNITSMIQFGFITGTLVFAFFSIADRFSASRVFFLSSVVAALANVSLIWFSNQVMLMYLLRFLTGFFLAGIYPVGMKIASDWYEKGLGKALGYLVGALALGTAFPHLLKSQLFELEWQQVLIFTSLFATLGGVLVLFFVGDGPYKKEAPRFQPSAVLKVFRSPDFRAAANGYFGHMWELYTFWLFVPALLALYNQSHPLQTNLNLLAFVIVALGSVSTALGGIFSLKVGSSYVAWVSMLLSGICCVASFFFPLLPPVLFYFFMITWGVAVISDSPQFSALIARTAPAEYKGTALTIVTSIGFAITIVSIQLISWLFNSWENGHKVFILLAPGPLLGLFFIWPLVKRRW